MASISEKDAIRLGLIKAPGGKPSTRTSSEPKPRSPSMAPRKAHKGGRIRRDHPQTPFKVSFFVPLEPKTKERPRTSLSKPAIQQAFRQSGGSPERFAALLDGIRHRTYTPDDTAAFEKAVAVIASSQMRGDRQPYAHPVHIDLMFVLAGDEGTWPTDVTDPDLDNVEKAICDALNKVIWKDDRLMVSKRSIKVCGPRMGVAVQVRDAASAVGELLELVRP